MRAMVVVLLSSAVLLSGCGGDVFVDWPDAAVSGMADGGAGDAEVGSSVDAGTPPTSMVRATLEAPANEAIDQPCIGGSFSGVGWDCKAVTPGGVNGRTLTWDFTFARAEHIANVCFRACGDRVLGRWALHKANGQQVVLAPLTLTVGGAGPLPLTVVDNGQNSYNWKVDLRNY